MGYDTFAMVVNFIDDAWHPNHITIGLFEVQKISNAYMEKQMKGYWGYWIIGQGYCICQCQQRL